jgi:hypothetical protein
MKFERKQIGEGLRLKRGRTHFLVFLEGINRTVCARARRSYILCLCRNNSVEYGYKINIMLHVGNDSLACIVSSMDIK